MNKRSNPFFPQQTAYPHPPLPPGPPPSQVPQYDYSAYWAAAQTGQSAPSQPIQPWPAQGASVTPSGSNPLIAANQSSLYANYGYGRQNLSWPRHPQNIQPQRQVFPIPQAMPPLARPYFPAQQGNNRTFTAAPFAHSQQTYRSQQPMFNQQQPPPPQHSPPNLPPAKRPRFEGSQSSTLNAGSQNTNRTVSNMTTPGRAGGSSSTDAHTRGTPLRGRGGSSGIGGGANIGMMRGVSNVGGRGGRGSSNRGSHGSNQMGGHRGGRGGWHGQNGRRGGGSRGRGTGFSHSSHVREGGNSKFNIAAIDKDRSGKKEESRQTLTDFRIAGLEIECLDWKWGSCSTGHDSKDHTDESKKDEADTSALVLADGVEEIEFGSAIKKATEQASKEESSATEPQSTNESDMNGVTQAVDSGPAVPAMTSPPRIRIYFNTPVSFEDFQSKDSATGLPSLNRAKRKMSEEAEGEKGPRTRTKLNPSPDVEDDHIESRKKTVDGEKDRGSAAPSVDISATASVSGRTDDERDWLMEAIAHDGEVVEEPNAEDLRHESGKEAKVTHDEEQDNLSAVDVEGLLKADHSEDIELSFQPDLSSKHDQLFSSTDDSQALSTQTTAVESIEESSLAGSKNEVKLEPHHSDVVLSSGHDPEPPASPASQDNSCQQLLSQSINGTSNVNSQDSIGEKSPSSPRRLLSPNRVSISYASGARRILIDAQIVETVKIWRGVGKIEIILSLERQGDLNFKGLVAEAYSNNKQSYDQVSLQSDDDLLPPLAHLVSPSKMILVVYLDKAKPMTEPRWVKTGDLEEWLRNTFGLFWARDQDGWEKRIEVVDPDPPPTIHTVLETWSISSLVGLEAERQKFIKAHMSERNNMLEIFLRLVRGERATPGSFSAANTSSNLHLSGPLLTALSPSSPHAAQQTHLTLAVVAMVRMAEAFAERSMAKDRAQQEVDERVGEIIRCLPQHLLYKSLDGIFREWKDTKKRGRG